MFSLSKLTKVSSTRKKLLMLMTACSIGTSGFAMDQGEGPDDKKEQSPKRVNINVMNQNSESEKHSIKEEQIKAVLVNISHLKQICELAVKCGEESYELWLDPFMLQSVETMASVLKMQSMARVSGLLKGISHLIVPPTFVNPHRPANNSN